MKFFAIDIDRLLDNSYEIDTEESHINEKIVEIDKLLEQTSNW